jgi:hypothetical protein
VCAAGHGTRARGCDSAESRQSRPREIRARGEAVDHGVGRARWASLLATAGYVVGVVAIVWGLLSGDFLAILLGLVIVAIVLVAAQ